MSCIRCTKCTICQQEMSTKGTLEKHYMYKHKKQHITRELVKSNVMKSSQNKLKKASFIRAKLQGTVILDDKNEAYSFIIEDSSEKPIQLSVNNVPVHSIPTENFKDTPEMKDNDENDGIKSRRKSKRLKKQKRLFHIDIRQVKKEVPKSLCENTGEFYECHCKETYSSETNKASSDTESCPDMISHFYCSVCGNGYNKLSKLREHEKIHLFKCKMCHLSFNSHEYKQHIEQHLIKIFVCYWCNMEFINKDMLMTHLSYHFEQQTFENVLNMEEDYNVLNHHGEANGDYYSHLNNIKFFLSYPYDHYYSRMLLQRTCDYCLKNFQVADFERHLNTAHCSQ